METLTGSHHALGSGRSKKKASGLGGFQAVTAVGLMTTGMTIGLLGLAVDSAAAWGCRSACVPVVRVCRSACVPVVRSCGSACVPTYARPTYYPRSRHAYPTFYGS